MTNCYKSEWLGVVSTELLDIIGIGGTDLFFMSSDLLSLTYFLFVCFSGEWHRFTGCNTRASCRGTQRSGRHSRNRQPIQT